MDPFETVVLFSPFNRLLETIVSYATPGKYTPREKKKWRGWTPDHSFTRKLVFPSNSSRDVTRAEITETYHWHVCVENIFIPGINDGRICENAGWNNFIFLPVSSPFAFSLFSNI